MSGGSLGAKSVEELLREHGFTPFHSTIVIVTGMAGTFVALEILLIAFSLPVFVELWELSAVYPDTVELFPTVLRGTAFGFAAEGVGKLTAILGPLVFGFLRDATEGVLVPLVVVALVMTVGGVVVATLGHETKGSPLE